MLVASGSIGADESFGRVVGLMSWGLNEGLVGWEVEVAA